MEVKQKDKQVAVGHDRPNRLAAAFYLPSLKAKRKTIQQQSRQKQDLNVCLSVSLPAMGNFTPTTDRRKEILCLSDADMPEWNCDVVHG